MAEFTQESRQLRINTPLGEDALLLAGLTGTESISRLFRFDLELYSERPDIAFEEIVGTNVTISVRVGDEDRYLNGVVRRFKQLETTLALTRYHAEIVPWLWFLTRTADCRIFQDSSVPDIVAAVFETYGFEDFEFDLEEEYAERGYCVQYRETAFDFVSRLLEEEGIHYFFRHEDGKHTLVCVDAPSKNPPCAVNAEARFNVEKASFGDAETVITLEAEREARTTKVALRSFNFETPKAAVDGQREKTADYGAHEVFDYTGRFLDADGGNRYARVRMEEQAAGEVRLTGKSYCRGFTAGNRFDLVEHPRADFNQTLLLLEVHHEMREAADLQAGRGAPTEATYENRFVAIPHETPYRPARRTPRPRVGGSQTAYVVGPEDEEIHTDKYGRVRLRFHWDHDEVDAEENRSCWVRVSQGWAGKNWGTFFLPRIGQEVVVDFLEGDPDRPLVTGCVYNAESMPPYNLPDNKTMSGIKSRSSKDGAPDMLNTIRFEDKADEEQVFLQAQRNLDIRVKNDRFEIVGNDRHLIVTNNRHEKVENDHHDKVERDRVTEVGRDDHLTVAGKQAIKITESHSMTVEGDVVEVFQANHSEEVTGDCYVTADNIVIEGATNVTIKVGQSYIAIESGGIKLGTTGDIELEATGNITSDATAEAEFKGSAGAKLKSDAITEVKGSLVKIN